MNPYVGDLPWPACDGSGNVTSCRLEVIQAFWMCRDPSERSNDLSSKTPQFCINPLQAAALQQQSCNQHLGCCLGYLQCPSSLPLGGRASRKSILLWLEVLQRVSSDHQHGSPALLGCAANAVFHRNETTLAELLHFHLDLGQQRISGVESFHIS